MATITKDYVSFETAKLLKEKGFDEYYPLWYNLDKPIEGPFFYKEIGWYGHNSYDYNGKRIVSAPTLQMAMKWLREEHNIHIELNWEKGNQLYSFQIWKPEKYQPEISSLDLWRIYKDDNYIGEWNYEEACEAAIKYCLKNLI